MQEVRVEVAFGVAYRFCERLEDLRCLLKLQEAIRDVGRAIVLEDGPE